MISKISFAALLVAACQAAQLESRAAQFGGFGMPSQFSYGAAPEPRYSRPSRSRDSRSSRASGRGPRGPTSPRGPRSRAFELDEEEEEVHEEEPEDFSGTAGLSLGGEASALNSIFGAGGESSFVNNIATGSHQGQ